MIQQAVSRSLCSANATAAISRSKVSINGPNVDMVASPLVSRFQQLFRQTDLSIGVPRAIISSTI
jgi:hypothetical protein